MLGFIIVVGVFFLFVKSLGDLCGGYATTGTNTSSNSCNDNSDDNDSYYLSLNSSGWSNNDDDNRWS